MNNVQIPLLFIGIIIFFVAIFLFKKGFIKRSVKPGKPAFYIGLGIIFCATLAAAFLAKF